MATGALAGVGIKFFQDTRGSYRGLVSTQAGRGGLGELIDEFGE